MTPKGKVSAVCRNGRFRDADVVNLICRHREDKQDEALPQQQQGEEQETAATVALLGGAG